MVSCSAHNLCGVIQVVSAHEEKRREGGREGGREAKGWLRDQAGINRSSKIIGQLSA